jgi:hypothetical protein
MMFAYLVYVDKPGFKSRKEKKHKAHSKVTKMYRKKTLEMGSDLLYKNNQRIKFFILYMST